ncbi:LysE family translocator [Rheinheimera tilapiae]|jgi:threonine/homoserine/homoserine lactone efflux protein|uniref:LysE family translocator n=1 Tax=Rheinheimera tilapiae TaxID=875043 RepID=A0ABV6BG88_9GAMM
MDVFFAVFFFALSSTITPGPNNIMMMSSGVNYGVRASLAHLCGICLGFPAMVLLVGLGFGLIFTTLPWLHTVIKVIGVVYLLWLAWKIAGSGAGQIDTVQNKPLNFWQAAAFQWVNAKAWVMASGAIAAFTTVGGAVLSEVLQITAAFLLVSFPCVGAWLTFGAMLRRVLNQPHYRQWFNYSMALLLLLSVLPVVYELWLQAVAA